MSVNVSYYLVLTLMLFFVNIHNVRAEDCGKNLVYYNISETHLIHYWLCLCY